MKWFCLLASLAVAHAQSRAYPELTKVRAVYLLPMTYSLDQFLAIRLNKVAVVQVVTDPNLADSVMCDHIGPSLQAQMNTLFGEKKDSEPADKDKAESFSNGPMAGSTRSKGAIFLVDRKTRNVIWSDYAPPKNGRADEVDHVADKIVTRFEKDKRGKP